MLTGTAGSAAHIFIKRRMHVHTEILTRAVNCGLYHLAPSRSSAALTTLSEPVSLPDKQAAKVNLEFPPRLGIDRVASKKGPS